MVAGLDVETVVQLLLEMIHAVFVQVLALVSLVIFGVVVHDFRSGVVLLFKVLDESALVFFVGGRLLGLKLLLG